jgi:hypothetical protein
MKSGVLVKVSKQTLSFWYQMEGGDYAALTFKEGNVVPLCFYANGNEFSIGTFAKERCQVNDPFAFTNYFETVKDPSKYFVLLDDKKPFKQLLYFGIESFLSHFIKTILYKHESIEAFRSNFCLRFWFDDDLESSERIFVLTLFKEAGYENVSATNIDNQLKRLISSATADERGRFYLSAIANDLYVQLFSSTHQLLGKFKLPELGSDPRARILAKLILEDIKEANPHIYFEEDKEIGFIINHCTSLLSSLTPLIRNQIELSTGVRTDYKVRLGHMEERLAYNRGIEDKVIPQLESILGENRLHNSLVDLFLLGDQINTNYFNEKLTKKFPYVTGVPNSIEAKILKSIFVEIASNGYELEVSGNKSIFEGSFDQEREKTNLIPNQEKPIEAPPVNRDLILPGIGGQGNGSKLPQTPPVVKALIPPTPPKVEGTSRVQVKPVTFTTIEKIVVPTKGVNEEPPKPQVPPGSNRSFPPEIAIPVLSNSLTLQEKLAKKIQQNFPDAEVKKVDKDNYVDIFIPSIYPKRGAHLFFNTSKDEIKIGFYCRDEEFINGVLAKQSTLEPYSQGIRPKGNKSYSSVEEVISFTLDFLSKISGKSGFQQDQKKETNKVPPPIISVSTHRVPPPPPPPPPIKKK